MKKNLLHTLILILSLLIASGAAHALQVIDVADGKTVSVSASMSQLTRIGMTDGSQLAGVFGVKGQVKITKDDDAGEAFIQPMTNKRFSIFVRDEYGDSYNLLVTPVQTPGEMILLRPKRKAASSLQAEKSLAYVERVKRMLKVVVNDDQGDIIKTDDENKSETIPFWKEATLRLVESRESAMMAADIYTLTNTSGKEMRLAEDEFKPLHKNWRLISVRKSVLKPGQTTHVYVIHDRN